MTDEVYKLKVWRAMNDLTMQELANRCGISIPVVNKIENGNNRVKLRTAMKIANVLGISIYNIKEFVDITE